MSTNVWINFFISAWKNPRVRGLLLTLYYLAILVGLALLKGDFSFPPFVYQGF